LTQVTYGESVYQKLNEDGSVRHYPGNSVVLMVEKDNDIYTHLKYATRRLKEMGVSEKFMMLPPSSYHMTVIQGVNDQVRKKEYWSSFKDINTPLATMNHFFQQKIKEVQSFKQVSMSFDHIKLDNNDLRINLRPKNDNENQKLRNYRDRVSEKFGVKLPNHDTYSFHITLGYVWKLPDKEESHILERYIKEMNDYLQSINKEFELTNLVFVCYKDMFDFPGDCHNKEATS